MTLREFVERVKIENSLTHDTDKLINSITDVARKQKQGNVACLSEDEVKNIILNYKEDDSKEETKPVEDKKVNNETEQLSLFGV